MKKLIAGVRESFFKIKTNFLSLWTKFFNTKFGKFILATIVFLRKFFRTKKGKFTLIVASFASYLVFFNWQFSAVLILMLYMHELGHIWAMKRCNMKIDGMYFIPFVGAVVYSQSHFSSRKAEVFIAIMGPIFGFALAIPLFGIYLLTKDPLYAAMSGFVAIFNWFNLLPFYPFDGGRIVKTVLSSFHWRLEKVTLDLSGLYFFVSGLASIYFKFWLAGLFFIFLSIVVLKARSKWQKDELPKLKITDIFASIICYLIAMVILLGFPMWILNLPGVLEAAENISRYK